MSEITNNRSHDSEKALLIGAVPLTALGGVTWITATTPDFLVIDKRSPLNASL